MASSPSPALPAHLLDSTLGAAFLGHFVTAILYGITSLQAFIFCRHHWQYQNSLILKLSVFCLWILDTVHAGLITGAVYWYCIINFTNVEVIEHIFWGIPAMVIVSNLSNAIVRGFFGYRLFMLAGRSWILPGIIAVLSLCILIDALYFSTILIRSGSSTTVHRKAPGASKPERPQCSSLLWKKWCLYAGLSIEVAVDLIVAIFQCILLHGFETGIRSTDSAIHVLMTYSINTGLLTSLCAVAALVAYAAAPNRFIYFTFYFVLSKLYVNSLLATLNARGSLLSKNSRWKGRKSVAIRNPTTITANLHDHTYDLNPTPGIEFTTVISAEALSTDSAMDTSTKIDEEYVYRG